MGGRIRGVKDYSKAYSLITRKNGVSHSLSWGIVEEEVGEAGARERREEWQIWNCFQHANFKMPLRMQMDKMKTY